VTALLEVRDLEVSFRGEAGIVHAVRGLSLSVERGARVGVIGESGAGKTVAMLAIVGLLRAPGVRVSGELRFAGIDLTRLRGRQWRAIRGRRIGMVFQNSQHSLNPTLTIGYQLAEPLRAHLGLSRAAAASRAAELLAEVRLAAPARLLQEYPHRLSGGMRQRVMIAIALACEPELVIADEPTTALDVTVRAQVLQLLCALCEARGSGLILVTHDLGVLAGVSERIVVMYAGRVMEEGDVDAVYRDPAHPYTAALMRSIDRLDRPRPQRLTPIPGEPPSALDPPGGCPFHPRCAYATARCAAEDPRALELGGGRRCACHYAGALHETVEVSR
jgi:oligopeptide/dipeptide ABC transporter ATP-binding protein